VLAWETRKELAQKAGGHKSTRRWQQVFAQMPDYDLDYMGEFYDKPNSTSTCRRQLNV
jgi:hypothetical protein